MDVVIPIVLFLIGLATGGVLIWFLLQSRLAEARQQERNIAQADSRVAEERVIAKVATIERLQSDVAARDHSLRQRNEENIQLREQNAKLNTSLRNEERKTQDNLKLLNDAEDKFVLKLSEPVLETLEKLNDQISAVKEKTSNVGAAATNLVKALQKPDVRGQWGEMSLERVFEICGLTEGRDYHKQRTIGDDETQLRPDYIVCMPGGLHLAIDAKAPISAFLEAADADGVDACEERMNKFVAHVRERVKNLNSKRYHQNLEQSPEFVVLFLPTEAIISAALRLDVGLIEFAKSQNVIIAGPTIVMSIVMGVAHGWKQESLTKHAMEIAERGKELYKRLADFAGHIAKIGVHLKISTEAYNAAVGSFQSRVMPQARRLEELKVAPTDKRIPDFSEIDTVPRELRGSEFAIAQIETDGELIVEEALVRPR